MVIGIYGGTFDPIHYGHINAARSFLRQCALTKLYIVPAAIPPHKRISPSDIPDIRLEMVKLAFRDDKESGIYVSDYEIKTTGRKNYTVYTLEYYRQLYKNAKLILLCGSDMFETLENWHDAPRIFKLAAIAHVRRGHADVNDKAEYFKDAYGADIVEIDMPRIDISSTALRRMIADGADVSDYIPPDILDYIKERKLYGMK